jgi:hypothetical protein
MGSVVGSGLEMQHLLLFQSLLYTRDQAAVFEDGEDFLSYEE